MKLALVFDAKFYYYQGEFYNRNLTLDFFKKRYFPYVDEIVIVGRKVLTNIEPKDTLVRSPKIEFRCIEDRPAWLRIFSYLTEFQFIKKSITDCDVVIFRGWWGCHAAKQLHKPYMIEVIADAWNAYWYHGLLGKLVAIPIYLLTRYAIKHAPYVLYVTSHFLQCKYPTQGIQEGISDVELLEETNPHLLPKRIARINLQNRPLVLGTAAAINVRFKGQQYVIQALALLKKKGVICHYELVGNGDKKRLEKLAKKLGVSEQVRFIGAIQHSKIFAWYDNLDIYIQPSLQEGLPRAVVEAMSRALPCIGACTGGIPELIDSSCIYTPRGNMAKKIADMLETFHAEKMELEARRNFKRAQDFNEEKLKIARDNYMREFLKQVIKNESNRTLK